MNRKLLRAGVVLGLLPFATDAAEVTLTPYTGTSDWPASSEVATTNAFADTNGGAGLTASRHLEQSFTLSRTLTVESVYLTIQDYDPGAGYSISFYQMGGSGANSTNSNDWNTTTSGFTGGQLGSTISTFTGEPAVAQTGNFILRIDLTPEEQITLGAGEYFVAFHDTGGTQSFLWRHSNNSPSNYYVGGRYYVSSSGIVSQASYRDFGLALDGTTSETPVVNPPSGLTVLTGNARALLEWVAPVAPGITDYTVEFREQPAGTWTEFVHAPSTATNLTVTGLTNGTAYDFRVSAVTSESTSAPSTAAPGTPEEKTFLHVLSAGQSLSVGGTATPILSNSQPYDNMMLSPGPSTASQPNNGGPAGASLPLIPLVEGTARPGAVETPSSGMANYLRGSDISSPRPVVVGLHGLSGSAYTVLKKGAPVPADGKEFYAPYDKGMAQAQNTKNYVETTLGCTYRPLAVTLIHGEQDYVLGLTGNYDANLVEWQQDYESDLSALTGTSRALPFFMSQMNSGNTGEMAVTQLNAHRAHHGKIYLVGPKYQYPTNDGTHLTNVSSKAAGEMLGKVIKKVMLDNEDWDPLMPSVVVGDGNVITVSYHIPVGSLVLDTTLVTLRPDYGFEFTQTGGNSVSISSVQLINNDTEVQLTLSDVPTGTDQRLRYAWGNPDRTSSNLEIGHANPANAGSVGGNIRDQDSTVSPSPTGSGQPLYNWSVAFEEAVLTPLQAWRKANFGTIGNTGVAGDDADPDGDGSNNRDEFIAKTDPNDPLDVFKGEIQRAEEGIGITIRFTAKANLSYGIEYNDELDTSTWQALPGATFQVPSETVIEHTDLTIEPRRFYRVRTPAP